MPCSAETFASGAFSNIGIWGDAGVDDWPGAGACAGPGRAVGSCCGAEIGLVTVGAMVCRTEGAARLSWIGAGLETAAVGTGGGTICRGGSGTGAGVGVSRVVTIVAIRAGAGVSVLTTGAGRGRKVVWGTGGMVPWGTVLLVDAIGGMVVVGIGASAGGFAVLGLMGGGIAETTPVAVGGGADAASPEAKLTEGAG